jgi:hypothetical protein
LDSNNQIVEPKNQQVQRRYRKQTNVSAGPAHSSTRPTKQEVQQPMVDPADSFLDLPMDEPFVESAAVESLPVSLEQQDNTPDAAAQGSGGLAGAIARSREVKQELEKTRRQQAQAQGVRRI